MPTITYSHRCFRLLFSFAHVFIDGITNSVAINRTQSFHVSLLVRRQLDLLITFFISCFWFISFGGNEYTRDWITIVVCLMAISIIKMASLSIVKMAPFLRKGDEFTNGYLQELLLKMSLTRAHMFAKAESFEGVKITKNQKWRPLPSKKMQNSNPSSSLNLFFISGFFPA